MVGIEHEYRVIGDDGRPVDFRHLLRTLPLVGVRLDPSDPSAVRGPWGGAITADGPEAEVAVAPVAIGPGFSGTAVARARVGRERLQNALPDGFALGGYSTHISVEVGDRIVERAALRFARVFAPALMLLLDGRGSPGLLVRPRPGRLELGGEFADGDRLRAAIVFATGCAQATVASLDWRPWRRTRLPGRIRLELEPATERFGWFVSRTAAGSDVYAAGRRATLALERGGIVSAQRHLEHCWAVARRSLGGRVDREELDLVDAFVLGERSLGLEVEHEQAIAIEVSPPPPAVAVSDSPFGSAVALRQRGDLRVEPAVVSWDFVVLRISGPVADGAERVAFACLPRNVLGPSLEALDAGHLDVVLRAYLTAGGTGSRLSTASQARSPGLYRSVGTAARLLRSEHGPAGTGERPGKRDRESRESQEQPPESQDHAPESPAGPSGLSAAPAAAAVAGFTILGLPAAAAAAVAGVTAVAVLGGVLLLGGGPTPSPSSAAIATATSPIATVVTIPVPTVNWAELDVCTLLDEATVQEITGESEVGFTTGGGGQGVNGGDCFWGATRAGFPAYVELRVAKDSGNLFGFNIQGQTCSESPVAGVGTKALGGTCPPPPQQKVFLVAIDQGVEVRLLVNEPKRPLDPGDLAAYVNRVLQNIRSPFELPTPEPFIPDFTTGTATVRVTGDATASAVMTFANESMAGEFDRPSYPVLAWSDATAGQVFGIYLLKRHAVGSFSTADGTLGMGIAIDLPDSAFGTYVKGAGLGHESLDADPDMAMPEPCTATITSTPTGGITGTMSCANINHPTLVYRLEATFAAEPATPAPPVALTCTGYLTAAEIATATGQTAGEGVSGTSLTPGEIVCNYDVGGTALTLSIWDGHDLQGWYEGTVEQMRNTGPVSGLGLQATYGGGPMAFMSDALAVLGNSAVLTFYRTGSSPLGQAAMRSLAEIVLTRLE